MKKALVVASVASMIDQFNIPNIMLLQRLGYKVDVATNFTESGSITAERSAALVKRLEAMGVGTVNVPIPRSLTAVGAILKSYKVIKRLCRENKYEIMHCHSPIGGAIARLATRGSRKKNGTKAVYTAHGLHFYKGAPLKNKLLFYPVEKLCARFTDVLITINKEDYELAKRKLRAKRVEYVPGVGIDTAAFASSAVDALEKRRELGVPDGARLLLSVGELNANKNHKTVLEAMKLIGDDSIHYAIAGKGALKDELKALADELGIGQRVHLLGYREDVRELYHAADVFVHPSYREGLPVSVMEAMASGLPVVASRIRGNVDLIKEGGGILVSPTDTNGFAEAIRTALADGSAMGEYNKNAIKDFSFDVVEKMLEEIYR